MQIVRVIHHAVDALHERDGMVFRHHYYPVLDNNRCIDRVVVFSRDITQSKKAEETLHRYRDANGTECLWKLYLRGSLNRRRTQIERRKEKGIRDAITHAGFAVRTSTVAKGPRIRFDCSGCDGFRDWGQYRGLHAS